MTPRSSMVWAMALCLLCGREADAQAVPEPVFTLPGTGEYGFLDFGPIRTSAHLDLADGVRAYVVIPSRHGFTIPDSLVLAPDSSPVPASPRSQGVEIDLDAARYRVFDRPVYVVFDLSGGQVLSRIEQEEPLAHFFLPESGYFNPFMAALLKGIPFTELLRDDVGVLMPLETDFGGPVLHLVSAISVGYDDLVVARIGGLGTYLPVALDRDGVSQLLAGHEPLAELSPELTYQVLRHGLVPPGELALQLAVDRIGETPVDDVRRLAVDYRPLLERFRDAQTNELYRFVADEALGRLDQTRGLARTRMMSYLLSGAQSVSVAPSDATASAALARMWDDPEMPDTRQAMAAALLEDVEYWQDYRKDGERFDYDSIAALIVLLADRPEALGREAPVFGGRAAAAVEAEIRRLVQAVPTDQSGELTARDFYGAGLIASLSGDRDAGARHSLTAQQMFRERIGEMNAGALTVSTMYKALAWGRMIGAHRNPHRYRALLERYEYAKSRYERCQRSRRQLILKSYTLKDFANQDRHTITYVEAVRTGILNCGGRPIPPRPGRDKPEGGASARAQDGLQRFQRMTSTPGELSDLLEMQKTAEGLRDFLRGKVLGRLIPDPRQIVLDEILARNFRMWGEAHRALAMDPPRADFHLLADPEEVALPASLADAGLTPESQGFLEAVLYTTALLDAAVITVDRLGGAQEAGSAEWIHEQEIHLDHLKHEIGEATLAVAAQVEELLAFFSQASPEELGDPALEEAARRVVDEYTAAMEELLEAIQPLGEVLAESY